MTWIQSGEHAKYFAIVRLALDAFLEVSEYAFKKVMNTDVLVIADFIEGFDVTNIISVDILKTFTKTMWFALFTGTLMKMAIGRLPSTV